MLRVLLIQDDKLHVESWLHLQDFIFAATISCCFPTAMHETSKRLSQMLRDIYEPDWNGVEDLAVITDVCFDVPVMYVSLGVFTWPTLEI